MAIDAFTSQIPQSASVPLTDPKTGVITRSWFLLVTALFRRTGDAQGVDVLAVQAEAQAAFTLAGTANTNATAAAAAAAAAQGGADASLKIAANLGDVANVTTSRTNLQIGPATAGWADPTGAGSRATFDMDLALPAGAAYSQAEMTAVANQVIVLQKRLGQLELDLITAKAIKH